MSELEREERPRARVQIFPFHTLLPSLLIATLPKIVKQKKKEKS
jgi:hypothetical protein